MTKMERTKIFEGLGTKQVLYKVTVAAKSKTEAIRKIRAGDDVVSVIVIHESKGFALGGGGNTRVKEIINDLTKASAP